MEKRPVETIAEAWHKIVPREGYLGRPISYSKGYVELVERARNRLLLETRSKIVEGLRTAVEEANKHPAMEKTPASFIEAPDKGTILRIVFSEPAHADVFDSRMFQLEYSPRQK